jgi:hypothetical protein
MSLSDAVDEAMKPNQDGKHWMAVMDATGDTKIMWSRDNPAEVEVARTSFEKLKKEGYTAFRVTGKDGVAGEQMRDFDPNAERIIFTKPPVGG